MMLRKSEKLYLKPQVAVSSLLLITMVVLLTVMSACNSEDATPTVVMLPTATPGVMTATATPTVLQSDDGVLQVGFHIGLQGYPQQGSGVLRQVGRGTEIEITVIPAPGTVQQISIREGRCDAIGRWVTTVDPAIGGVSKSELIEQHISELVDGNHIITVSVPGGTFSEISTCGDLPDLSHLELPALAPGE